MVVNEERGGGGVPAPEILRELTEQTTPDLLAHVFTYAQRRARLVRRAGYPVSTAYGRELVDDAHADTWSGAHPWDPSACSLLAHLIGAIRRRTWREMRHAKHVTHVALPQAPGTATSVAVEQALASAAHETPSAGTLSQLAEQTCRELWSLVTDDDEAEAVVRAWQHGIVERDEVLEITGLSETAYRRARKRLLYASRNLPPELREAAEHALRSA